MADPLTQEEREAMRAFPALRPANPVRFQAAVTFGSLWRKLSKHWDALVSLEERGLVERRKSRGEILWRPTKPRGLEVHAELLTEHEEPPVDPLLIEAREIAAAAYRNRRDHDFAGWVLAGDKDGIFEVQVALAALRRGIELAKEQSNG